MKDFIIPPMDWKDERDMGTPAKQGAPVTLSIDGINVTVPEGTSVMRAAAEAGIQVPKLCATDSLEAFGSCRLCVVEIEGRRGTPASCTTPVAPRHGRAHAIRQCAQNPPRRDGALYQRPPAGLPDLLGQWRLRIAGYGGGRGPARCALYRADRRHGYAFRAPAIHRAKPTPNGAPRMTATPISATTRRNALSAIAVCAPARKCKAPSR